MSAMRTRREPLGDRIWRRLAKLVPARLAYWVLIGIGVEHVGGPDRPHEIVPEVAFTEVLSRFGDAHPGGRIRLDGRYLLSHVIPVPMRSTYRLDGPDGRSESASWWQWRGRIARHRVEAAAAA